MIKAILIDDELSNLNSLKQKILQHCASIEIIASCSSPEDGINAIETLFPDLVFLDIEMPRINGFNLLQKLGNKNFELIFVTAYDHYAIKAIRFSAMDYLVKPVEVLALPEAVERVIKKKEILPNHRLELLLENAFNEKRAFKKIAIPSQDGLHFIKIEDIIYLEANSNYTKFHISDNKKHLVCKSLKEFEDILPAETFIRIHNSCIINKDYIERYIRGDGGQVILEGNIYLDISKRKKAGFLKAIGG